MATYLRTRLAEALCRSLARRILRWLPSNNYAASRQASSRTRYCSFSQVNDARVNVSVVSSQILPLQGSTVHRARSSAMGGPF